LKKLLSIDEAATSLSIGRTLLYSILLKGDIESITIGNRRLIPAQALDLYIESRREASRL
jgi:excisionase family DNA binding protein